MMMMMMTLDHICPGFYIFSSWGSEIINSRQRGRNYNSISYFISGNMLVFNIMADIGDLSIITFFSTSWGVK
jgi:hypothetical protein